MGKVRKMTAPALVEARKKENYLLPRVSISILKDNLDKPSRHKFLHHPHMSSLEGEASFLCCEAFVPGNLVSKKELLTRLFAPNLGLS